MSNFLKLADLAQNFKDVEVAPGQFLKVRPIPLTGMVNLLLTSTDEFINLYAAGIEGKLGVEQLTPFLLSSPKLAAKIIAIASEEADQADQVEKYMPATVQLIALAEIWKLSVPDAKKAKELLSEVTVRLQRLVQNPKTLPNPDSKQ